MRVILTSSTISAIFRKIWSSLRFYPNTNICCIVLSFLCLCWYVSMKATLSTDVLTFRNGYSVEISMFFRLILSCIYAVSYMCRRRWSKFPSVLQSQQLPHKIRAWLLSLYGLFYCTVL